MTDGDVGAEVALTDAEWRAFQSIPEQGYSHRKWLDSLIAARVEAAKAEALREAAGAASWMEYPTSQDPTHWAAWLRHRAAALDREHVAPSTDAAEAAGGADHD